MQSKERLYCLYCYNLRCLSYRLVHSYVPAYGRQTVHV